MSVAEIQNSIDKTAISAQELDASMNIANDSVSALVASIQQVAASTMLRLPASMKFPLQ